MAGFVAPNFDKLLETTPVGWTGDWHGNTQWAIHAIDSLRGRGVSIVYQLGDFGLWGGQDGAKYLRKVQRTLGFGNMLLIVTPGNHENYDMLETFPLNQYGFRSRPDIGRIWFAPRGHIWSHHGANLASLGGAGSIDKARRKEGRSWWSQEEITEKDVDSLRNNMAIHGLNKIDVMMTHDAPAGIDLGPKSKSGGVPPEVEHYCHKQRLILRDAVDIANPRTLMHGHWHLSNATFLNGVTLTGENYRSEIIGLDMDMSAHNMMLGELAPSSGILGKEVIWR